MDNSSGPASFPVTLSYISFVIGIISFIITVLNLLALYANFLGTVRSAPVEIRDSLGNLRAQLLEEREALRQQTRELRNRKASMRSQRPLHPAHAGRARSRSRNGLSPRASSGNLRGTNTYALTYSEQTLGLHYQTVRDLWRQFKSLERPFLVRSGSRAEALRSADAWAEKDFIDEKTMREEDIEMHGDTTGFADWSAVYRCDFSHRFIWWQSKSDVVKLADEVQRVMLRRMEREVTCVRMMLKQIRDGGDGPEEIASPWLDGGGGGGGATASGRAGSRGPVPLGMRRRPTVESYNVYESSESSSSTTGPKSQRRPDERDPRVNVAEMRQGRPRSRPGPGPGPGAELRYTGDGWRQGQFTRVVQVSPRSNPPPILEPPRPSRPRTRSGYDGPPGPPSPYDRRR